VNQERVFQILLGPHMSEKAAIAAEDANQYVFKVALDATKIEIKTSVEQLFKVKVDNVRTLRVKGKSKRNRFGMSTKPTWKKAYVRLEQGQDIDFAALS
jgi:large subunit ribosomal protein L23